MCSRDPPHHPQCHLPRMAPSPWDGAGERPDPAQGTGARGAQTESPQRQGMLRPPGWWWHGGGTAERAPRRKQVKVWHLLMDGLEELTLVFPNFGMVDLLHQLGVFVDEPRFPEYVGSSIFHLEGTRGRGWREGRWRGDARGWGPWGALTRFVSCVSIMKLCTCFSALVSSSFLATTATTRAVQPAPCSTAR